MKDTKKDKNNKYSKKNKSGSNAKKAILIILFPFVLIGFAIFNGFFLDAFLQFIFERAGIEKTVSGDTGSKLAFYGIPTLILGVFELLMMYGLLKGYDKIEPKKKTPKWYFDKQLIPMFVVGITSALVLITTRYDDTVILYIIIGLAMFPLMGIIATPNAIRYALKDMEHWRKIFYKGGNLHKFKDSKDFYKIKSPLPYRKKIYFAVLRDQFLNVGVVIFIMILIVFGYIWVIHTPDSVPRGQLVTAVAYVKVRRAEGYLFFGMIFIATFAIPIIAYYITNAVYKLRTVRRREYIAYHAIVNRVDGYTIKINQDGRNYRYDYCSCVGIRAKNVNDTGATLIFIPDDVLLIPDKSDTVDGM